MPPFEHLSRRMLIQRVMLIIGASSTVANIGAFAAPVADGKKQFPAERFALVSAICSTIIPKTDTPGALEAGVPKGLESLLGDWASPMRYEALTEAMLRIDQSAMKQTSRPFAALSPEQRTTILRAHDAAALALVTSQDASADGSLFADRPVKDPAYSQLKELIVLLYYYSEAALSSELPYEHAPGTWRPSIPVTPETRPFGGVGQL